MRTPWPQGCVCFRGRWVRQGLQALLGGWDRSRRLCASVTSTALYTEPGQTAALAEDWRTAGCTGGAQRERWGCTRGWGVGGLEDNFPFQHRRSVRASDHTLAGGTCSQPMSGGLLGSVPWPGLAGPCTCVLGFPRWQRWEKVRPAQVEAGQGLGLFSQSKPGPQGYGLGHHLPWLLKMCGQRDRAQQEPGLWGCSELCP